MNTTMFTQVKGINKILTGNKQCGDESDKFKYKAILVNVLTEINV